MRKFLVLILMVVCVCAPASPRKRGQRKIDDLIGCHQAFLTWRFLNDLFYLRNVNKSVMDHILVAKGLAGNPDLNQPLLRYILGLDGGPIPQSVVELGFGFGRVVDFLRLETDIPEIHAIDSGVLQNMHLRDEYGAPNSPGASLRIEEGRPSQRLYIYQENIASQLPFPQHVKFDVALWMFAGFSELSPEEKRVAMWNLTRYMNKHGILVVDMPVGKFKAAFNMRYIGFNSIEYVQNEGKADETRLRMHPIKPSLEVDFAEVNRIITARGHFHLVASVKYKTSADSRKLLFYRKGSPALIDFPEERMVVPEKPSFFYPGMR